MILTSSSHTKGCAEPHLRTNRTTTTKPRNGKAITFLHSLPLQKGALARPNNFQFGGKLKKRRPSVFRIQHTKKRTETHPPNTTYDGALLSKNNRSFAIDDDSAQLYWVPQHTTNASHRSRVRACPSLLPPSLTTKHKLKEWQRGTRARTQNSSIRWRSCSLCVCAPGVFDTS